MHLFVTFIMRALLSFLKDFLFYQGIALYSDIVFVEGAAKSVNQHCVSIYTYFDKACFFRFFQICFAVLDMQGNYQRSAVFYRSKLHDGSHGRCISLQFDVLESIFRSQPHYCLLCLRLG